MEFTLGIQSWLNFWKSVQFTMLADLKRNLVMIILVDEEKYLQKSNNHS